MSSCIIDTICRGALPGLLLLTLSCAPAGSSEQAYNEGQQALRRNDHAAAIAAFERAAALDPANQDALLKLGIARAAIEDWSGAVAAYDLVLDLEPQHPQALNNTANVYFRQGLYEQAAAYYDRALEAKPDYFIAMNHYGWVLRQLNRPGEAEQVFRRCVSTPAETDRDRQTIGDCRFYIGALRYRAEDYTASVAAMEEVLTRTPSHSEARYYLGMSYRKLGRLDEARQQLDIYRRMLRSARSRDPISRLPRQ